MQKVSFERINKNLSILIQKSNKIVKTLDSKSVLGNVSALEHILDSLIVLAQSVKDLNLEVLEDVVGENGEYEPLEEANFGNGADIFNQLHAIKIDVV